MDLIDTLWNVKAGCAARCCNTVFDLIDTLWNVKQYADRFVRERILGFNRYIVECKDSSDQKSEDRNDDLIDTLWNVKTLLRLCR